MIPRPRHPTLAALTLVLATVALFAFPATDARALPPIPEPGGAGNATTASSAEGNRLLRACLEAHGGAAAYGRLRDVNVRLDGRWEFLAPKLQPKLADPRFRGGSEERYLPARGGYLVGQHHTGPAGQKHVRRTPPGAIEVWYERRSMVPLANPVPVQSADPEARAAAALVADAYSMFLFGPEFFVRRGAALEKLPMTAVVDGRPCDEVLATLRPGFGEAAMDRAILFIDAADRRLRRVQFTLNGLESTQGAEVHVDLLDHARLPANGGGGAVLWPTRFYERIDRPVSVAAHRWRITGFDVNRGIRAADLGPSEFSGRAGPPAAALSTASGR